jgi:hypothetical protein
MIENEISFQNTPIDLVNMAGRKLHATIVLQYTVVVVVVVTDGLLSLLTLLIRNPEIGHAQSIWY